MCCTNTRLFTNMTKHGHLHFHMLKFFSKERRVRNFINYDGLGVKFNNYSSMLRTRLYSSFVSNHAIEIFLSLSIYISFDSCFD